MLGNNEHYIMDIILKSSGYDNISGKCSTLLHNMLLYGSSFTYSYRPEVEPRNGVILGFFSTIDSNGVKKLLMYSSLKDWKRYIDTLNYLAKLNKHSILSSDTVMVVGKLLKEAYDPKFISWAHISLKKNAPIVPYDHVEDYIDSDMSINIDYDLFGCEYLEKYANILVENLIPLTLVSFHSGIHRYKQAINQVVFQTLTYYISLLNHYRGGECESILQKLLKYMVMLQSAIMADTYVWMPYAWNLKEGAFLTEYLYSIASQPLSEFVDLIKRMTSSESITDIFRKVQKTYLDQAVEKLNHNILGGKYGITSLIDIVENIIKNTIITALNYELRIETLIGRLKRLGNEVRKKIQGRTDKRYDNIVLLATEQTSILLLGILREILDVNKFYILYTPQTLYQILLLISLGLKSERYSDPLLDDIKPYYIPIPSNEPYICESILENLLGNIDVEKTFFLLQGPAILVMPLYFKLLDHNIGEKHILIY